MRIHLAIRNKADTGSTGTSRSQILIDEGGAVHAVHLRDMFGADTSKAFQGILTDVDRHCMEASGDFNLHGQFEHIWETNSLLLSVSASDSVVSIFSTMGVLFEQYHVEPVKGTDITIGNHFPEVFVSETDEVLCYIGICLNDESRKYTFMHPYYMQGKHILRVPCAVITSEQASWKE